MQNLTEVIILQVLDSGVGVIGTSKGGDLALSMAAFIPSIVACVTINCFCAPINQNLRVRDIIYQPLTWDMEKVKMSDDGVIMTKNSAPGRKEIEKRILPIEKSKAAFLFLVGSDDRDINSEFYAQIACQHLAKNNYKYGYHVESFPGTGHLLEPPYSPHCYASFQHTFMTSITWGGSAKHHIAGQENAWKVMQKFLWHHLVERAHTALTASQSAYHLRSQL